MVIAAAAICAGHFPHPARNCIKADRQIHACKAKSIDRGNRLSEKIRFEMECIIEKKEKEPKADSNPSES